MKQLSRAVVMAIFVALSAIAQENSGTAPENERHPPIARSAEERRILSTISQAVRTGELYANVPAADGRMLRLLAETTNAQKVIEIGTSTGISGMWFSMALQKTGGHLTTFELDAHRAELARSHFQKAGVDNVVTIVQGDAHANLKKVKGPVDIVFIDAEKSGYVDYLKETLPLVRPGGLILAHNVNMVPDYVKAVTANSALDTVFYMQGNQLAISLKKR
jgi:predicted O-methyltransferase YrrM